MTRCQLEKKNGIDEVCESIFCVKISFFETVLHASKSISNTQETLPFQSYYYCCN